MWVICLGGRYLNTHCLITKQIKSTICFIGRIVYFISVGNHQFYAPSGIMSQISVAFGTIKNIFASSDVEVIKKNDKLTTRYLLLLCNFVP